MCSMQEMFLVISPHPHDNPLGCQHIWCNALSNENYFGKNMIEFVIDVWTSNGKHIQNIHQKIHMLFGQFQMKRTAI